MAVDVTVRGKCSLHTVGGRYFAARQNAYFGPNTLSSINIEGIDSVDKIYTRKPVCWGALKRPSVLALILPKLV